MNRTGALRPFLLASRTISSVEVTVIPFLSACCAVISPRHIERKRRALTVLAFWIVGPSAIGSVKGRPSSMTSAKLIRSNYELEVHILPAPPASIPSRMSTVPSAVGYPAVT